MTFSLSPILIILVTTFGLYFRSDRLANQVFGKIGSTIGFETARDIESIVENFMAYETSAWLTIGGLIFFVFVATTLLRVVKHNIHKLWRIRAKRKLTALFRERARLLLIIIASGALLLLSLLIDSLLAISFDYLQIVVPKAGIVLIRVLNIFFSLIVTTVWFTLIFKFLPEARVQWDVCFNGAFVTAILYNAGLFILGKILIHARIASIFGASASFALLLLFIFYSSFILYFGAAFTHEYAEHAEKHICAGKYGSEYEEKLIQQP